MSRASITMVLCVLVACGPDSVFGPPTESVCPPSSTLTYTNFGQPFMVQYCTRCHSSELITPEERMILPVADHIDETTAAGPAATNKGMPPDKPFPTLEERKQLGEWIACGMPE
jgi:hypothetical protein